MATLAASVRQPVAAPMWLFDRPAFVLSEEDAAPAPRVDPISRDHCSILVPELTSAYSRLLLRRGKVAEFLVRQALDGEAVSCRPSAVASAYDFSQDGRVSWDRMRRLIDRWLPPVRVYHAYPLRRLGVIT